jgi:hypothetical protein
VWGGKLFSSANTYSYVTHLMSQKIENKAVVLFSFLPNVFFPRFFKCWVASLSLFPTTSQSSSGREATPDSLLTMLTVHSFSSSSGFALPHVFSISESDVTARAV